MCRFDQRCGFCQIKQLPCSSPVPGYGRSATDADGLDWSPAAPAAFPASRAAAPAAAPSSAACDTSMSGVRMPAALQRGVAKSCPVWHTQTAGVVGFFPRHTPSAVWPPHLSSCDTSGSGGTSMPCRRSATSAAAASGSLGSAGLHAQGRVRAVHWGWVIRTVSGGRRAFRCLSLCHTLSLPVCC